MQRSNWRLCTGILLIMSRRIYDIRFTGYFDKEKRGKAPFCILFRLVSSSAAAASAAVAAASIAAAAAAAISTAAITAAAAATISATSVSTAAAAAAIS